MVVGDRENVDSRCGVEEGCVTCIGDVLAVLSAVGTWLVALVVMVIGGVEGVVLVFMEAGCLVPVGLMVEAEETVCVLGGVLCEVGDTTAVVSVGDILGVGVCVLEVVGKLVVVLRDVPEVEPVVCGVWETESVEGVVAHVVTVSGTTVVRAVVRAVEVEAGLRDDAVGSVVAVVTVFPVAVDITVIVGTQDEVAVVVTAVVVGEDSAGKRPSVCSPSCF
ncbi:hypothetical protein H920_12196 [Fukomys damarensis]|uniref:Uncharacterized protein n=1 Tax=Fukomys damarensis TaxID=885580 RepID=A0A091D2S8_FUKDA|nr:hypothetical protein H920_12196 [Fukomys damarensis]